jgi:CO/xanthine dehydrogenase FAD-binding subunit
VAPETSPETLHGAPEEPRIRVYYPATVPELLQTYRRRPDSLVFGGGTYILSQRPGRFLSLPECVISLQNVEELRRVARTERYVEIGAGAPLETVVRLGTNNIPRALCQALSHVGPPAVRGLATIGGNLGIPGRLMTTAPVLALLDAQVELRRHGGTRWVPVVRLHANDGSIDLRPGEVISRVRVPLYPWRVQVFRRFGSILSPDSHPLVFCGLARVSNGILEELRVVGSTGRDGMLRYKEIEAELVGRRLPLASKEIRVAADAYGQSDTLDAIQQDRFARLIQWFLLNLQTL